MERSLTMANRSKSVGPLGSAVTGRAAVPAGQGRRRVLARRAFQGLDDSVLLVRYGESEAVEAVDGDPSHAPGHRHLPLRDVLEQPKPPRVYGRPFGKDRRGLGHPGKI